MYCLWTECNSQEVVVGHFLIFSHCTNSDRSRSEEGQFNSTGQREQKDCFVFFLFLVVFWRKDTWELCLFTLVSLVCLPNRLRAVNPGRQSRLFVMDVKCHLELVVLTGGQASLFPLLLQDFCFYLSTNTSGSAFQNKSTGGSGLSHDFCVLCLNV